MFNISRAHNQISSHRIFPCCLLRLASSLSPLFLHGAFLANLECVCCPWSQLLMSPRVTRSSARLAVDPSSEPPPSNSTRTSISTRKRKASNNQGLGSSLRDSASDSSTTSVARKAKRHKPEVTTETISRPGGNTRRRTAAQEAEMSPTASSSKSAADTGSTMGTSTGSGSSSKRKGSRSKKPPPGRSDPPGK